MKLHQLLEEVNKEVVLEFLEELNKKSFLPIFDAVITNLKELTPKPSKIKILAVSKYDGMQIFGYDAELEETVPLIFVPWSEWLGMEIDKRCLELYEKEYILLYCILEMITVESDFDNNLNNINKEDIFLNPENENLIKELLFGKKEETTI